MTYKDLLEDKMNWKIINMIVDKFMRFEDMNFVCSLDVCIPNAYAYNDYNIYGYNTNDGIVQWETKAFTTRSKLLSLLKKNGFEYKILIEGAYDEDDDNHPMKDEMDEMKKVLESTNKLVFTEENTPFDQYIFKEKTNG